MFKREQNNEPMQTIAYHRDRGEELQINTFSSIDEFVNIYYDGYIYLINFGKYMIEIIIHLENFN